MIENLITILMLLGILLVLNITNIILGVVIGSSKEGFKWKKLGEGILKVFLFCLSFLAYCSCIEVMPMILARIDIIISEDIITLAEIVGITLTAYKKYAKDCYDKIITILKINKEGE